MTFVNIVMKCSQKKQPPTSNNGTSNIFHSERAAGRGEVNKTENRKKKFKLVPPKIRFGVKVIG